MADRVTRPPSIGLGSLDDPALAEFVRAFRTGPQTPEPGAPRTGGRSTPR